MLLITLALILIVILVNAIGLIILAPHLDEPEGPTSHEPGDGPTGPPSSNNTSSSRTSIILRGDVRMTSAQVEELPSAMAVLRDGLTVAGNG